jgi:hypothetical protein
VPEVSVNVNRTLSNGFTAPVKVIPFDSNERPENDCPIRDKRPFGPAFPPEIGLRDGVGDEEISSCPTAVDAPQTSGSETVTSTLQPKESIPPLFT